MFFPPQTNIHDTSERLLLLFFVPLQNLNEWKGAATDATLHSQTVIPLIPNLSFYTANMKMYGILKRLSFKEGCGETRKRSHVVPCFLAVYMKTWNTINTNVCGRR